MATNKPNSRKPGPKPDAEKTRLYLLRGDRINAESLAVLFEKLTGKKATPEQIEAARKKFDHK